MIFDTSIILKILDDKEFFDKLNISEEVKITSVTAYELLRGAFYSNLTSGRDRELKHNTITNFRIECGTV
ncbi:MAG: hypothetical protein QW738_05475 [Nitrososphaeria archaeon]